MRDAKRVEHLGQLGKPRVPEQESRVGDRLRIHVRSGIAVDRDERAARTQNCEDGARMTAATKRCVDVDAVVANRERRKRFGEEHGNMAAIARARHPAGP